jgi:hypothetical protein
MACTRVDHTVFQRIEQIATSDEFPHWPPGAQGVGVPFTRLTDMIKRRLDVASNVLGGPPQTIFLMTCTSHEIYLSVGRAVQVCWSGRSGLLIR